MTLDAIHWPLYDMLERLWLCHVLRHETAAHSGWCEGANRQATCDESEQWYSCRTGLCWVGRCATLGNVRRALSQRANV